LQPNLILVNLIVKKLLQESINVAVKSWGVKCFKYSSIRSCVSRAWLRRLVFAAAAHGGYQYHLWIRW